MGLLAPVSARLTDRLSAAGSEIGALMATSAAPFRVTRSVMWLGDERLTRRRPVPFGIVTARSGRRPDATWTS